MHCSCGRSVRPRARRGRDRQGASPLLAPVDRTPSGGRCMLESTQPHDHRPSRSPACTRRRMVDPTKRKPRWIRSFDNASDSSLRDGGGRAGGAVADDRVAADPAPQVGHEPAELVDQRQDGACVVDGRADLQAVAHDAGIVHQASEVRLAVTRDLGRVPAVEGRAIVSRASQGWSTTTGRPAHLRD